MRDELENKMDCGKGELLVACLYGEASEQEERAFLAHCDSCVSCQTEFQAFNAVRGELQTWQIGPVPPIEIVTPRTAFDAFREFAAFIPMWLKLTSGLGAAAAAALVLLAVTSARVSVGTAGITASFGTERTSSSKIGMPAMAVQNAGGFITRQEAESLIVEAVAQAQSRDRQSAAAQMAGLEARLTASHKLELRNAVVRLEEQRRLNTRLMMADSGRETLTEWLFAPGDAVEKTEGNDNEKKN